jgi:hypothetical protein
VGSLLRPFPLAWLGPADPNHRIVSYSKALASTAIGPLTRFRLSTPLLPGSTLIACFGAPPLSHEDDTPRAVLAALSVCERLHDLGFQVSSVAARMSMPVPHVSMHVKRPTMKSRSSSLQEQALTPAPAAGLMRHRARGSILRDGRVQDVLGDSVNLAARLMQRACGEGGGVMVDSSVLRVGRRGDLDLIHACVQSQ